MTPPIIAALGLEAVAAAMMSSVDSTTLSAASSFTWNFYRPLLHPSYSDKQIKNSILLVILGIGIVAT